MMTALADRQIFSLAALTRIDTLKRHSLHINKIYSQDYQCYQTIPFLFLSLKYMYPFFNYGLIHVMPQSHYAESTAEWGRM